MGHVASRYKTYSRGPVVKLTDGRLSVTVLGVASTLTSDSMKEDIEDVPVLWKTLVLPGPINLDSPSTPTASTKIVYCYLR